MLRVRMLTNAERCKSYYSEADYYFENREETIGRWGGKLGEMLGLSGVIEKQDFENLCDNINPKTGQNLTARTHNERTVAYDFTFSVPKSISLLYGLTEDPKILEAFRSAVSQTMHAVEAEMKTRVRVKGQDTERVSGNLLWSEFIHTTSRPIDGIPDPHLHMHAVVFNATYDSAEQKFKAGYFRDLKRDAPYFQSSFRSYLANNLQSLGYRLERKRDDFELASVTRDVVERFSRRTAKIEEIARKLGIQGNDKAKDILGETTRECKNKNLTFEQLQEEWNSRLSDEERNSLAISHSHQHSRISRTGGEREAVDYAISHCFARSSVVELRKLETEALKRGVGEVTVESIKKEIASRPLIVGQHDGRWMATTNEVLSEERQLIHLARAGRGKCRPLVLGEHQVSRDYLNAGQRAAIQHVLGSRDKIILVRGAAGTGKTTLETELGEAIVAAGKPVVAIAPSAQASRGVLRQEANFAKADTLAKFMSNRELRESARGGVVLCDESSLVGATDALALFNVVSELDCRLVLVGDRFQHRAVPRGQPIELLEKEARLPVAEVNDILRQQGEYKRATLALSKGNTAEGFAILEELGWIRQVADEDRNRVIAETYLAATREKRADGKQKTVAIIAPTHLEGAAVTQAVREQLKAEKLLGKEVVLPIWRPTQITDAEKSDPTQYEVGDMLRFHKPTPGYKPGSKLIVEANTRIPIELADRFEVYRPGKLALAEGDRIQITAGGSTLDGKHRVENGSIHTLKAFDAKGNLILDNGFVLGKEFGFINHGYTSTSHNAQGRTVDIAIIAQSSASFGASNQRQFYVSVSRAREWVLTFTDSLEQLRKAVQRPDKPLSATEFTRHRKVKFRGRLKKHLDRLRKAAVAMWRDDHQRQQTREDRSYGYGS